MAQEVKAGLNLRIGSANLAPLLDLNPADKLAQNIGVSARLTLAGNQWTSTISTAALAARGCAGAWR